MTARSTIYSLTLCLTALLLPTAAFSASGFARSSATLRAGPGTSYPKVVTVSRGEALEVYGCLDSHAWCDVATDGDRGWFPGSRIEFQRDGRRMRLADNFALFGLAITSFGRDDYWGSHYSNRSWFNDPRWRRDPPRNPPRQPGITSSPGRPDIQAPANRPMPSRPTREPTRAVPNDRPVLPVAPRVPNAQAPRQDRPPMQMRAAPQSKSFAPRTPTRPAARAPSKGRGDAPGGKPLLKPM